MPRGRPKKKGGKIRMNPRLKRNIKAGHVKAVSLKEKLGQRPSTSRHSIHLDEDLRKQIEKAWVAYRDETDRLFNRSHFMRQVLRVGLSHERELRKALESVG